MTDEFSDAETAEFIRLLKKIQANDYWVPTTEAWQEVHRTFSRWCVELVISDTKDGIPRIFLTRYTGDGMPDHKGLFHIPGGFEHLPEDIEATCSRIAKDELGLDVQFKDVLSVHKWTFNESPIKARLLSLYVSCSTLGELTSTEAKRFFSREEMLALGPKDMDQKHPHRKFIDTYLKSLEY
jgi:ADP-ribose pyrophosphatase YjhB (NUDIX family)